MMQIRVMKIGYRGRIIEWELIIDEDTHEVEGSVVVNIPEDSVADFVINSGQYIIDNGTVTFDPTLPKYRGYFELDNLMNELKDEMRANDYKQFKYIRGELGEDEWNELCDWYTAKRAQYQLLEEEMSKLLLEQNSI